MNDGPKIPDAGKDSPEVVRPSTGDDLAKSPDAPPQDPVVHGGTNIHPSRAIQELASRVKFADTEILRALAAASPAESALARVKSEIDGALRGGLVFGLKSLGANAPSVPTEVKAKADTEVAAARQRCADLEKQLESQLEEKQNYECTISDLETENITLQQKIDLRHLLERISPVAASALSECGKLEQLFDGDNSLCDAYVVSIDLRRSTDLMLKANSPKNFADFITALAASLRHQVLEHGGVFDKFTGDGILAFFPKPFSGEDAGLRAVRCASECHTEFRRLYDNHRRAFKAVLATAGLGVGIDYGSVAVVRIQNELTIVGEPVVYACRLGGAPAGKTYVNQGAYNELFEKYSDCLDFKEVELDFKHDGAMLVYSVGCNPKKREVAREGWKDIAVSAATGSGDDTSTGDMAPPHNSRETDSPESPT